MGGRCRGFGSRKDGTGAAGCLVDELGDVGHWETIYNARAGYAGIEKSRHYRELAALGAPR